MPTSLSSRSVAPPWPVLGPETQDLGCQKSGREKLLSAFYSAEGPWAQLALPVLFRGKLGGQGSREPILLFSERKASDTFRERLFSSERKQSLSTDGLQTGSLDLTPGRARRGWAGRDGKVMGTSRAG